MVTPNQPLPPPENADFLKFESANPSATVEAPSARHADTPHGTLDHQHIPTQPEYSPVEPYSHTVLNPDARVNFLHSEVSHYVSWGIGGQGLGTGKMILGNPSILNYEFLVSNSGKTDCASRGWGMWSRGSSNNFTHPTSISPESFSTEFSNSISPEEKYKLELKIKDHEIAIYREKITTYKEQIEDYKEQIADYKAYMNNLWSIIINCLDRDTKDKEIKIRNQHYEEMRDVYTEMMGIFRLMAANPISVTTTAESKSMSDSYNTKYDQRGATISNNVDTAQDNARVQSIQNNYHYTLEQQQILAEAADEIQRLLEHLEQINPSATEADKKAYLNATIPPIRKQKFVNALQEGGKELLKGLMDNIYVNVALATIEGWHSAK